MTATATTKAPSTTVPSDLLRMADVIATDLNVLLGLADEMKNGPTR